MSALPVRSLWRRRLSAAAIGFTLALLVTELGLRLFDPTGAAEACERLDYGNRLLLPVQDESGSYHLLRPGATASYLGTTATINSRGLRNAEVAMPKPYDTWRILVLGDSVAFGWGVAEHDCFPRALERLCAGATAPEGCSRIEVVNAAIPGSSPADGWRWLRQHGAGYQPDLVLYFLIDNDLPGFAARSVQAAEQLQARRIRLPGWTQSLETGQFMQLQLDRLCGLDDVPDAAELVRAETDFPLLFHWLAGLRATAAAADARFVLLDAVGTATGGTVTPIAEHCRTTDVERVELILPRDHWAAEFAVSAHDPHPNAEALRRCAELTRDWLRERYFAPR